MRQPQKGVSISSPFGNSPYGFQPRYGSAHNRARLVRILLIVGALVSLASLLIFAVEFFLPHLVPLDEDTDDPQVIAMAFMEVGVALFEIVIYIATLVAFLMWLYRSYENLPSLGVARNRIKYSSGWAVGSFFIPFVSLVVPYRAVKELWVKSVPNSGETFYDTSPPLYFPLWWAAWLASNFANQLFFRISWDTNLSADLISLMGITTGVLDIAAALLAFQVVGEIDRQQTESANLISGLLGGPHPPPPPVLNAQPPENHDLRESSIANVDS